MTTLSGRTYSVLYAGICGSDLQKTDNKSPLATLEALGHEIVVNTADGVAVVNPMISCKTCKACTSGSEMLCPSLQAIGRTSSGAFSGTITVPSQNLVPFTATQPILGVLADPLAVVLHGMQKIEKSEHILILGDGIIAQLTLLFCILNETAETYTLISKTADRAKELTEHIEAALPTYSNRITITPSIPENTLYDTVIECVGRGQSDMINAAIDVVAPLGTILSFGVYPVGYKADLLLRNLLYKEVRLIGSNSYNHSDLVEAAHLIEGHEELFSFLIGDTYTDVKEAFYAARTKRTKAPKKVVLTFEELL